ncbi:MAG: ABC transporter ATP-binding protein [Patescibacteria group bacterium]
MHIVSKNLSKRYRSKLAVKDVSLDIKPGQVLALLGPNGAGKSTTIKMLTGTMKPTSGQILVDGVKYSHLPHSIKSQLGVMPQEIIIWDDLNILENLQYSATIYNLSQVDAKSRISALIEGLKLESEIKTLAKNLSGGYKRRLNLAVSIIHDPEVVFLDEPTPGIDVQSRILLTDYIKNLVKAKNHSVVLTDHYLEEAEKLADYVVIIDNGEIIAQGTVQELKAKYSKENLLQIHLQPSDVNTYEQVLSYFQREFSQAQLTEGLISVSVSDLSTSFDKALSIVKKHNLNLLNLNIKQPTLEDIFLILTGRGVRE